MSQIAYCPECDSRIRFHVPVMKIGTRVTCPECGQVLEVVRLRPLELDWAYDAPKEVSAADVRWRDDPVQVDLGYYNDSNHYDGEEW